MYGKGLPQAEAPTARLSPTVAQPDHGTTTLDFGSGAHRFALGTRRDFAAHVGVHSICQGRDLVSSFRPAIRLV